MKKQISGLVGFVLVIFGLLLFSGLAAAQQATWQVNLSTPANGTYTGNVSGLLFLSANITTPVESPNVSNVTWAFVQLYGTPAVTRNVTNTTANLSFYGFVFDTTFIPDGRYNITVNATINSTNFSWGNVSPYRGAGFNITIDNTAPNATLLRPLNATNIYFNGTLLGNSNRTTNFSFTVQDNLDTLVAAVLVIDGTSRNFTNVTNATNGSIGFPVGGLSEGFHNWTVQVIDEALNNGSTFPNITMYNYGGNAGVAAVGNFTVDLSAPVFTVTTPGTGLFHITGTLTNDTNVSFVFTTIDRFISANLSAYITVDSVAYNVSKDGITNNTATTFNVTLAQGVHYWNITTNDTIGNNTNTSNTFNFTVDRAPPVFLFSSPANGSYVNGIDANFTFQLMDNLDANNLTAYIIVDSTQYNRTPRTIILNNTNTTFNVTLGNGIHYWNITTNDTATNSNTSLTYTFTLDSAAPNVTLVFPSEGLVFSQGLITFNWSVTDNLDTNLSAILSINGVPNITGIASANGTTTTANMFFAVVGSYNWTINVTDEAGHMNQSITINFTVRIPTGGSGSGGSGGTSRVSRRGLPAGGLLLTVYTTGRVSVDVGGTYQVLDLIRTNNNELADITFGSARTTLKLGTSTALDVNGDNKYDVTVTPIKVFPKRVDLRVVPSGQAAPGAVTLPSHIVPKRPALTGAAVKPKSTPKTGAKATSTTASTTTRSGSSGLGAVSGRAVDEAPEAAAEATSAAAGGFSVVMLVVSLLVLFSVVGLIYYLYSGKQQ